MKFWVPAAELPTVQIRFLNASVQEPPFPCNDSPFFVIPRNRATISGKAGIAKALMFPRVRWMTIGGSGPVRAGHTNGAPQIRSAALRDDKQGEGSCKERAVAGGKGGCWRKGRLLEERAVAGGKSGCWRKERLLAGKSGCWRKERLLEERAVAAERAIAGGRLLKQHFPTRHCGFSSHRWRCGWRRGPDCCSASCIRECLPGPRLRIFH